MIKNTLLNKSWKSWNPEILKTSKDNHNSWKEIQLVCTLLTRIFWRHSTCYFVYGFVFHVISEKTLCAAKVLPGIWERFLHGKNRKNNSYKFTYKFVFISFLSFRRNQNQDWKFQQVGGLVTRNIFCFFVLASRALLQRYAKSSRLL